MHAMPPHLSIGDSCSHDTRAHLIVDLSALRDNYTICRTQARQSRCAAVVKADAYGLGVGRVAPVLAQAGCRAFFVAQIEEGIELRSVLGAGFTIAVLNGLAGGSEATFLEHDLLPVLNDLGQLQAWSQAAMQAGQALPAALQVDTGMARFGFPADDLRQCIDDFDTFAGIDLRLIMSHLACADQPDHPANGRQLALFQAVRERLPGVPASLAASSGLFLTPRYHFDMVRPGAALYGLAPQAGRSNPMRPVVRLRGRVVQLRSVRAGTPVGYGHTMSTGRASRLATVAVGYADGFFRSTSGGEGWFDGHRLPVIGRISMDSIVLDATDLPPDAVGPGAFIDLISADRDVDAVAAAADTIGYEVLTRLGRRFHRSYLTA